MKKIILFALFVLHTGLYSTNSIQAAVIIIPAKPIAKLINPEPASVKVAANEFKSLSKKEKRERIKEIKSEIKKYKAAKKAGSATDTNTLLLVILAILLPPLAVYLHQGEANNKFWISLILTLLLWVPGVVYALIVVLGADK